MSQLAATATARPEVPSDNGLGYQPGTSTDTDSLALTYAALPCLLKLFALGLLMRFAKELR